MRLLLLSSFGMFMKTTEHSNPSVHLLFLPLLINLIIKFNNFYHIKGGNVLSVLWK